ncbi:hypothetical protein [Thomasclavelia cocleata]|uniref:hypothetical protein n=1 Tax=Thomasclavelia cocleata TaxID=69824 RepID=UPI002577D52D|nr:hypothetical protein [Thomasclavelia cocleata]
MKTLCCILNGKNVYLEQILVEYDHIPVFMIGKDEENYYLIICSEIEDLHYIIVKSDIKSLYEMLIGSIPMRDLFLSEKRYWDLISGEDTQSDIIEERNIEFLDHDYLPVEGAYYKIVNDDVRLYASSLLSMIQQGLCIDKESLFIEEAKNYSTEEFNLNAKIVSDSFLPKIKSEIIVSEGVFLCGFDIKTNLDNRIKYKKDKNYFDKFIDLTVTNTVTNKEYFLEEPFAA